MSDDLANCNLAITTLAPKNPPLVLFDDPAVTSFPLTTPIRPFCERPAVDVVGRRRGLAVRWTTELGTTIDRNR